MVCPKCGSENVTIQLKQVSSKTKKRNMGILWKFARFLLICCTGGLWLLVGRRNGSEKTKYKNEKIGICQNCGAEFKINK